MMKKSPIQMQRNNNEHIAPQPQLLLQQQPQQEQKQQQPQQHQRPQQAELQDQTYRLRSRAIGDRNFFLLHFLNLHRRFRVKNAKKKKKNRTL